MRDNTIYIVGNARTNSDNAIMIQFGSFFMGFLVDKDTGEILDLDATAILELTIEYIRHLFIGKSLNDDPEELEKLLKSHYYGSSQKAILAAYKDAVYRFNNRTGEET